MFVLAAFDEDRVFALLEFHGQFVLIQFGAAMVFITSEEEFAIEPDFPAILTAEPDLGIACLDRIKLGVGIAGDLFEHGEGLVEVDLAVVILAGEVDPFCLGVFAGIASI